MKRTFIVSIFLAAFALYNTGLYAQKLSGKYLRKLDTQLDGNLIADFDNFGIQILSSTKKRFKARYWGISNDSFFNGKIFDKKNLVFYQNYENKYFAVYIGELSDDGNRIIGNWHDNSGHSGDFMFVRQ